MYDVVIHSWCVYWSLVTATRTEHSRKASSYWNSVTWASWRIKSPQLNYLFNGTFRLTTTELIKNLRISVLLSGRIQLWLVDSPHKGPVMRKFLPCHGPLPRCTGIIKWILMHLNPACKGLHAKGFVKFELLVTSPERNLSPWPTPYHFPLVSL